MKRIFFVQLICSLMAFCAHAQIPTISSFSPASGSVGTAVTINGTNFSTSAVQNIVFFGAVRASVTAATSTSLTVLVPVGASFSPINVTVNSLIASSAQPFLVTYPATDITSSTFSARSSFATASSPYSLAAGDFDADGKIDVAVTNASSSSFSVFKNIGSAGLVNFAPKQDYTTLTQPHGLDVGDLNGDGKLDVVVVNSFGGVQKISVFQNVSTSTTLFFAPKIDYAVGNLPENVVIADFDADGKLDVAVTNSFTNNFSVLKNTSSGGSITLNAKIDFTTGTKPIGIVASDFDADGKIDIAITNKDANSFSIFKNTTIGPNISFAAKVDFATGSQPNGISVGDVTGDGKPDIAVANSGITNSISVYKNISAPNSINFDTRVDYAFEANAVPYVLQIADLNGDAKPDIAVERYNSNKISVFKNTQTSNSISFATRVDYTSDANSSNAIIAVDLDGDGKPDLAKADDSAQDNFSVFKNQNTVTAVSTITTEKALFNIFPNPCKEMATIHFQKNYANKNYSLQLLDLNGQVLKTQKIKTQKEQLDLTPFSNGIFTINLLDEKNNRLFAQKIIKQ